MPTYDGESEKFELFEEGFQTSLKNHNQLSEDDRINYFPSLMRGDALQTFKNINGLTRENLGEILAVFRRKSIKHQSMATAKHKFQKLVFNQANQKLVDFLNELQKLAEDAFGIAIHAIIEQFIYAKKPAHLNKSINQAHLENGAYEQIVTHLERVLELNSSEAVDELHINTEPTTLSNAERPKPMCHHWKKLSHYRNQCRLLKEQRKQTENNQKNPGNKNSDANNSKPNSNFNNKNNNNNSERAERKPKTVYPPSETCGKANHSTEKCYFGANAANPPPPRHRRLERQNQVPERNHQSDSNEFLQAVAQNLY